MELDREVTAHAVWKAGNDDCAVVWKAGNEGRKMFLNMDQMCRLSDEVKMRQSSELP